MDRRRFRRELGVQRHSLHSFACLCSTVPSSTVLEREKLPKAVIKNKTMIVVGLVLLDTRGKKK